MSIISLIADRPPIRVTPVHSVDSDRDVRLEKAVALVTNSKCSVRKAAQALSLPKSTVHRYLQATRGAGPGVTKRPRAVRRPARPSKCDISFLVEGHARKEDWWTAKPSHTAPKHSALVSDLTNPQLSDHLWSPVSPVSPVSLPVCPVPIATDPRLCVSESRGCTADVQAFQNDAVAVNSDRTAVRNLRRIWT